MLRARARGTCAALGLLALGFGCGRPASTAASGAAPAATPKPAIEPDMTILNDDAPGKVLDLGRHVVPGKTTLFEFYSSHCAASAEMAPVLRYLSKHRGGLAIRQVAIDRPEASEIDFDSPLAEQYSVQATPSFRIHDESGALVAQGKEAKALVRRWYQDAQLAEHSERLPGVSNPDHDPN